MVVAAPPPNCLRHQLIDVRATSTLLWRRPRFRRQGRIVCRRRAKNIADVQNNTKKKHYENNITCLRQFFTLCSICFGFKFCLQLLRPNSNWHRRQANKFFSLNSYNFFHWDFLLCSFNPNGSVETAKNVPPQNSIHKVILRQRYQSCWWTKLFSCACSHIQQIKEISV